MNTTDIKALREALDASTQFINAELATGGKADLQMWLDVVYPEFTAKVIKELIESRDQLEAERQNAHHYRTKWKESQNELAALRGEQEPVDERAVVAVADLFVIPSRNGVGSHYVTDAAEAMRISKRNDNSAIRQYVTMRRYQELFTRQPKPVVDDSMALAFHQALNDGGIGHSDLEEIKTGLRAALGIYDSGVVKDGE